MSKNNDLTGQKLGRLTVLYKIENKNGERDTRYHCLCDCGNYVDIKETSLKKNTMHSCGCYTNEVLAKHRKSGRNYLWHGKCDSRIYHIWDSMRQRCNNPNHMHYQNYGGRGITYCKEWDKFIPFYEWAMESGYNDNLSIDRIDNNGNYEPSNCKWSNWKEQARNRRNSRYYTINGETKSLAEWAEIYNIQYNTALRRLKIGWDIETALSAPIGKIPPIHNNKPNPKESEAS